MDNTGIKKRGPAAIFSLCPARHLVALVSGIIIVAHLLTRQNHALNVRISEGFVRPLHFVLTTFWARLPFSAAEMLITLGVVWLLGCIALTVYRLVKTRQWFSELYRLFMSFAAAALCFYALFCLLWGAYFYGDDFMTASGLESRDISAEELEKVTLYFAELANEYSGEVLRDDGGEYCASRQDILSRSASLYLPLEEKMPCLKGPEVSAKPIFFSRIMSYLDFTGFFFPLTAEANVNTDFPLPLFPATVAHELAHLRGVAKEQEANFVAVLACMESGDRDYKYSAALMAYTYLGNALHSADYERWEEVYTTLSDTVKHDLLLGNAYWAQFDTPVQTVSNTVYEGFLQSYDQKLGMKSYGACVDLLVCYYLEAAQK